LPDHFDLAAMTQKHFTQTVNKCYNEKRKNKMKKPLPRQ